MKINVLLVDDEAIDLEWLRRRVLAGELNLQVAATANNGFNALKAMEQERIDLILSDIRMPIMSGIEFARKAKEINPHVKIIFISGHDDFEYAKEAIRISVSGYLLKPVEDQELYKMLGELCAEIERERDQDRTFAEALTLVNEELLLRWLNDISPEQVEGHIRGFLDMLLKTGTAAALVEIDDLEWKTGAMDEDERRRQIHKVMDFVQQFSLQMKMGTFLVNHPTRFVLLSAVPETTFLEMLEELIRAVRQISPFSVTVGVGGFAYDGQQLRESYRQAQAALSAKWLVGKDRLIREAGVFSPESRFAAKRTDEILERMLKAILNYDLVTIDDCLLELFYQGAPLAQKNDVYDLIIRITTKLHADLREMGENLYELLKWDSHQPLLLFQFETIHDIMSWLRRRFFELSELLYAKKRKQKRKLIRDIMQYVENNLEQKITLKEVAAQFDFTPNYLGYLFKEETGVHFSEYLNDLKTKRVCELLTEPTLKIYEIAERMGYKNIIYFNRQFKQATGMTPGEYRKAQKI
ncbi:MAG: response regulator [Paenibacillus macerans]|uniref:response regulator n=1 Tax=Paenibacillus TaxID=44249 RepID=UPI001F0E1C6C|nr:response regulator [Paenibacillus macerans]MDU7477103.1 response regulator [Paenibacillus macerans]UMV47991.1 response regulator [Paenibacillus macerans]